MPKTTPTYRTLAELKAAFDSGELSRKTDYVVIDNDCTPCYRGRRGSWEPVFAGGIPEDLLKQALDLLGIPWEPA